MRCNLLAGVLLSSVACSHAPPPTETKKVERRDDWLLALKSDLELTAASDGFQGQVRVVHGGKPEVDRTFGETSCLSLGAGRHLLAAVAVGLLVEAGKLDWNDRLERRLPAVANTTFAPLTVANLLTDAAGLAHPGTPTSGRAPGESDLDWLLRDAGKDPLRAPPGTLVDPGDSRQWILVEAVISQVAGVPFEDFAATRVVAPADMTGTSLGPTSSCPDAKGGTTTLADQFRFIEALRTGKLVSPDTRAAMWEPRLQLGAGSEAAYGFFVRTRENQKAVGVSGEGLAATAYELWLDPVGSDALVLLGRTPPKTARGIRTALGEFYALPPGPPPANAPTRKGIAR